MRRETKVVLAWTPEGERWAVVYLGRLTVWRYASRKSAFAALRELRAGRRAPDYGGGVVGRELLWRGTCSETRH